MLTLPLLERHAPRVTQFLPSPLHATRGWQLVNMGGHNCWGEQGRDRGPAFPFLRVRKSSTAGTAQAGRARTAHPMHPPHPQSPSCSPGVLLMPPKKLAGCPRLSYGAAPSPAVQIPGKLPPNGALPGWKRTSRRRHNPSARGPAAASRSPGHRPSARIPRRRAAPRT